MRAGQLRKRITLQARTTSQSASGEQLATWVTSHVLWADIEPLAGHKLEKAQAMYAEATHEVLIRYQAGVTPKMRALYGSRIFNIGAVLDESERHRQLTLLCSEGLNDG